MKKIFILLLIFVCLFAGYFLYKSKNITIAVPVVTASPVSDAKSERFNSKVLKFEITLPKGLTAEEKTDGQVVIVGEKILIYELTEDPEKCKGVCSVLTKKEDVVVNNVKARSLEGYWEELGEENAQSFVSFVIPRNNKYLVFMLQELPVNSKFVKGKKAGIINEQEINSFKGMVKSMILF